MHFDINVSKDGTHFFATSSRSVQDRRKLAQVLPAIREAFTAADGYRVTVSWVTTSGTYIGDDELAAIIGEHA